MVDRALSLHRAKLIDLFTSIELFEYNEVFDYEKSGSKFFFFEFTRSSDSDPNICIKDPNIQIQI